MGASARDSGVVRGRRRGQGGWLAPVLGAAALLVLAVAAFWALQPRSAPRRPAAEPVAEAAEALDAAGSDDAGEGEAAPRPSETFKPARAERGRAAGRSWVQTRRRVSTEAEAPPARPSGLASASARWGAGARRGAGAGQRIGAAWDEVADAPEGAGDPGAADEPVPTPEALAAASDEEVKAGAVAAQLRGAHAVAEAHYSEQLRRTPDDAEVLVRQCATRRAMGNQLGALAACKRAAEVSEDPMVRDKVQGFLRVLEEAAVDEARDDGDLP